MKQRLLNIIKGYGPDSPVNSGKLEDMLGITGSAVRDLIRELRRDGEPVCNSKHGYYYGRDNKELISTINNLEARSVSMWNTAQAMRKNLKKPEQLKLF